MLARRRILAALLASFAALTIYRAWSLSTFDGTAAPATPPGTGYTKYEPDKDYFWRTIKHNYPVTSFRPLPTASPDNLPPVQARFEPETPSEKKVRLLRRNDIKESFVKTWKAYRKNAWLRDEVAPVSGRARDTFGGWGATLIDSLDTLWIMGLRDDFDEAVYAVAENALFLSTAEREINVFETTIRFLGGLLSAYDLSGDKRLLVKAHNVGDLIYKAFDTPNHMPITRWNLHDAAYGHEQTAHSSTLLAEIGSLSMEFTRLSLVTGDPKYHDAVQNIAERLAAAQDTTKLPGMWPIIVDPVSNDFDAGTTYTLSSMADSAYEYLPKMMALLNQPDGIYSAMYTKSVDAASRHLFFRPMAPDNPDVLFPGFVNVDKPSDSKALMPASGHLTCFVGGMLALGGKLTSSASQITEAAQLTDGCAWAYSSFRMGVMPETFYLASCPSRDEPCWDQNSYYTTLLKHQEKPSDQVTKAAALASSLRLPPGFTKVLDARYLLRPEAIESIFIMYRITGDRKWQEKAWEMWKAIDNLTSTKLANSAVKDVNPEEGEDVVMADSMESFWPGETLKYFYLVFSEPELIDLDEWVFNTEAHPFKRLKG